MPDRVDTAVHTVQLPALDAASNCTSTQTRAFELSPRHYTVLASGEDCHLNVRHVAFLTHVGT